jgi:hypothetical protein
MGICLASSSSRKPDFILGTEILSSEPFDWKSVRLKDSIESTAHKVVSIWIGQFTCDRNLLLLQVARKPCDLECANGIAPGTGLIDRRLPILVLQ